MVEVIKHGWLAEDNSYYFIDMEYCSETLEDRIRSAGSGSTTLTEVAVVSPSVSPMSIPAFSDDESISNRDRSLPLGVDTLQNGPQFDINWNSIEDILLDIISGLIYVHHKKIVHRDLKPRNGRQPSSSR